MFNEIPRRIRVLVGVLAAAILGGWAFVSVSAELVIADLSVNQRIMMHGAVAMVGLTVLSLVGGIFWLTGQQAQHLARNSRQADFEGRLARAMQLALT